jgi:uncharacterized coiled-coil protein SlyX
MSGDPSSSPADPRDLRLTALEEHAAFAEHTVDQLSTEIVELNKRIHTLSSRIDSLEQRLGKLLEPPAALSDESASDLSE